MNTQDSSKFSEGLKDKTIKGMMEGGYMNARPRTTRRALREFTTGFTSMTTTDKNLLMEFYQVVGGYTAFEWKTKIMSSYVLVRFVDPPLAKYDGIGLAQMWNVESIKLIEA